MSLEHIEPTHATLPRYSKETSNARDIELAKLKAHDYSQSDVNKFILNSLDSLHLKVDNLPKSSSAFRGELMSF